MASIKPFEHVTPSSFYRFDIFFRDRGIEMLEIGFLRDGKFERGKRGEVRAAFGQG